MSDLEWSPQQERALRDVNAWLKRGYDPAWPVYRLFGFAGTGKTTLAKHLVEQSGLTAQYCAFTGKAAYVLRQKGCTDARTIHSLIYRPAGEAKSDDLRNIETQLSRLSADPPEDKERARKIREQLHSQRDELLVKEKRRPMFTLNPDSTLNDVDVVIADECSMIDSVMGGDLLSFRKPLIVLGDPAQLPPVAAGGYFTDDEPHSLLTEIHRHAKESGILRMATDVRERGTYNRSPGHYGSDAVVMTETGDKLRELIMKTDQVLVGRNATRHQYNNRIRELLGRTGVVCPGDKIVCLRNNAKAGLLNGGLWRVHQQVVDLDTQTVDMTISSEEDGAIGMDVSAWAHHFMGQEDDLKKKQWNRRDFEEFDHGLALTVHKSQGSQWDHVVLFDESGAFRSEARRWLYTGITRAAKSLVVS